jgi:hypothetical protein
MVKTQVEKANAPFNVVAVNTNKPSEDECLTVSKEFRHFSESVETEDPDVAVTNTDVYANKSLQDGIQC